MGREKVAFPHEYEWSILEINYSGQSQVIHFMPGKVSKDLEPLKVEFFPKQKPTWIGVFDGDPIYGELSGVFETPIKNVACVVSKGQAYFVNIYRKENEFENLSGTVFNVLNLTKAGLIALVSHTEITAFDLSGKKWRTEGLSMDGIRINEYDERLLKGEAFRPDLNPASRDFYQNFVLELKTGSYRFEGVVESRPAP